MLRSCYLMISDDNNYGAWPAAGCTFGALQWSATDPARILHLGRVGASATTCIQRCLEAGEQQGAVDRLPPLSRNQI